MSITAKGAVRSGGWENPHLRALPPARPESDTLTSNSWPRPPAKDAAVIQALLPVSATVTMPLPRYATTKVRIVTQTGSTATADIQMKR